MFNFRYFLTEQDPMGGGMPPGGSGGMPGSPGIPPGGGMAGPGGMPPPSMAGGPGMGGMPPMPGAMPGSAPGGGAPNKVTKIRLDDPWDVIKSILDGRDPDKESEKAGQSKENQVQSPEQQQPPQQAPPPPPQSQPAAQQPGLQHLQGLPGM